MSDGGKSKLQNSSCHNQNSQSVTSSPAFSRKSLDAKNTKVLEDKDEGNGDIRVSNYSNKVSDDINDMVEQIQAIQNDISELAGRPISLLGSK